MLSHCVTGGTFTYVHAGHEEIFRQCRRFSRITLGLTTDSYVRRHKIYPSFPYSRRLAGVRRALVKHGLLSRTQIIKIEDEAGGADRLADANAIIVSGETKEAARRINARRRKRGLRPLRTIVVPIAYGQDLKKISCGSIYEGKTDLRGKLLRPLAIRAATDNPTKLAGASRALKRVFCKKFPLAHHAEDSRVCAHPFNEETFRGAKNRAHAAWKRAKGKCDYALGMESGLFSGLSRGMHIDITACCVYDGREETYGTGMGFVVPERIVRRIIAKKSDLSEALREITGIEKIGWREGALGWFSAGIMHRREQIEAAVACAFVPRISRARRGMEY